MFHLLPFSTRDHYLPSRASSSDHKPLTSFPQRDIGLVFSEHVPGRWFRLWEDIFLASRSYLDRDVFCFGVWVLAITTMLLFICHVLLFAAKFIQAAPQKVRAPPKQIPVFSCNAIVDWNGTPTTVVGFALLLPKIFSGTRPKVQCPRGFYVPGKWDSSRKNILISLL